MLIISVIIISHDITFETTKLICTRVEGDEMRINSCHCKYTVRRNISKKEMRHTRCRKVCIMITDVIIDDYLMLVHSLRPTALFTCTQCLHLHRSFTVDPCCGGEEEEEGED